MEEISCIFCGIYSNNIVISENGYAGKKCRICGLIYVSPRPSKTEIANIYGHDNAQLSAQLHIEQKHAKNLQAHHHLALLKQYCKKGNLLEIGAGAGYFLAEAKKYGFEPFGIELNPTQAYFITNNLGIPCQMEPISPNSFANMKFDIIYHCDVASHFYDPIDAFTTMYNKLKSGGILFFETGNIGDVDKRYYRLFEHFQCPDHLFFFGQKSLYNLMVQAGFEIIAYYRYCIIPQLLFNKVLRLIRKPTSQKKTNHQKTYITNKKSFFKNYIKQIYNYTQHTLRYKIGRYFCKKNSPETIIIVARKKG